VAESDRLHLVGSAPVAPGREAPGVALPEHQRLTVACAALVASALSRFGRGERITWDLALTIAPGPTGQPSPVVLVYLHMPSAVLNHNVGHIALLDTGAALVGGQVDQAVSAAVEDLRRQRSASATMPGK
jgi:hypothetical protein